ncbi:MAG: peptidoglycan-binding protein, partial [Myxococcales bacterium]|nr:peptidoglycan-binding protein [Myxococcales bacterium]
MANALQNLQAAIQASAAQGPFALDAAYLIAGLADPGVRAPDSYDADLTAAFQVAAASAFQVSVAPAEVGPVAGDRFIVTRVSLPFIGVALQGTGTLTFSLADRGSVLVVQIESRPAGWTWTTSFPAMSDWMFTALPVTAATFVFSSEDGPTQIAAISCGVPAAARPLFALFDPVITAPPGLELRGALDLASYDGETILFPAGTLRGVLSDASFKLLYLEVIAPAIALSIPPPAAPSGPLITDTQQTPFLAIAADLRLDGAPSAYTLQVAIAPLPTGAVPFSINLRGGATGPQLTPATMLALAGGAQSGGQSYLSAVPPVLQQFMTSVSLRGLGLSGAIAVPPKISGIGLEIGSVPGMSWSPIPDAPTGLDFTFTSFALAWSLINPFDAARRQQTFLFSTQFTLAPAIFKGKTPGTDGVFTVTFDSSLQFSAGFAGTASLRDFVDVLSGGAVSLPQGIEASLSDITVDVDTPNRGFSFGSGFDVEVSFLEVGGKPILAISDGRVSLGAMTPTQIGGGPSTTAWQAAIAGTLAIGPVGANVSVAYDGFQTPSRWLLSAQLAQPVEIESVIQQFFDPFGSYDFPDFLPGALTLKTFAIAAQLGSKGGQPPTTYAIDTTFSWLFDLGDQKVGIDPAHLMLAYDGAKPAGQQFLGLAEGTWVYPAVNLELTMGYQFVPTAQGPNQTLYVQWEGFRASYETGKQELSFSLRGWTVGTLIQALVRTLGDPYFTLPSPWNLLDQISLDGLSLIVSLKTGVTNRLSAAYTLASPINLGFILIKGLVFRRDTDGKVTIAIDGTVPGPLQGTMGNLLDPAKGQDVRDMPPVPGAGEAYFKVFLLALGQRIGITGHSSFKTTQEAIRALEGVPSTISKQNPVNPTANKGTTKGIPYYEPANHWLVAGHLGLLQVAGVWTVDAMVVFDDPALYGLRLALAGPRAGGLAGLAIDILYKKITDDVGVFQLEFTFPDSIRNLNFGAVSIVLPQIGIQVYTNGDFLIDIGFPYNIDFRRSFSISAIVYGVPVLGSGGIYVGKLSSATATQVPRTQLGTFDPVLVFGVGLQLGLGYNFIKGPLQAGFALTVFGIIEGVIAPWHSYAPALASGHTSLQDSYYFKVSGTVGIIGLLYGKVDFAIIQAAVNVNITLSLKITYESFRAIPIVASARVDISLKVKIDLGLFSISISLSFATTVSATFVIGADQTAPWDDAKQIAAVHARRRALLTEGPAAIRARARQLRPQPKRRSVASVTDKPRLGLVAAPSYTVLATEGATDPATQQGAFVFLLAMDAPSVDGAAAAATTSFGVLCATYLPWLIETLGGDPASVTRAELEAFIDRLADHAAPVTTTGDLLGFLADHFILDIATTPASAQATRDAMAAGAVLFPVFDGLSLSVPDPSGGAARPIAFETYATATSGYRAAVA